MEGKCMFNSSKYLNFPYCTSIQKAMIQLRKHIHMDCVCLCVYVCARACMYVRAWECIYVYCFAQFLKLMNI